MVDRHKLCLSTHWLTLIFGSALHLQTEQDVICLNNINIIVDKLLTDYRITFLCLVCTFDECLPE